MHYKPWEIGLLTDYQIEKLIIEPALEKAKRMNGTMDEATVARSDEDFKEPTEDEYVASAMQFAGGTAEHWRREYRRLTGKGE